MPGAIGEWKLDQASYVSAGIDKVIDFVVTYPEIVAFEATCLAIVVAIGALMMWGNRKFKEDKVQGEQDEMKRRVKLESTYADKIHDFMLDMLSKGEINRKEYKRDCKRFGVAFRLLDLMRSPRAKIGIKHRVLRNVKENHSMLPHIQTRKIPGPKPGDAPAAPVAKLKKVWVVAGKRSTRA